MVHRLVGTNLQVVRGDRLNLVLRFTLRDDNIAEFEIVAEPARLELLEITVLSE